jgi:hypothetical protein
LQREGDTRRILLEEGVGVADALKAIRGPLFGLLGCLRVPPGGVATSRGDERRRAE